MFSYFSLVKTGHCAIHYLSLCGGLNYKLPHLKSTEGECLILKTKTLDGDSGWPDRLNIWRRDEGEKKKLRKWNTEQENNV